MKIPMDKKRIVSILKILLDIDDIRVIKYTIQSLIEEIEEENLDKD